MILGVKNTKESFKKKMIKLRIAIQMDPLNKLHHESDSSLMLAKEAQNRGHKIFIYEPKDLTLIDNQLFANASSLKIKKKNKYTFKKGKCCRINLSSINVLLIRQDPPFNINYITATYLLEHLSLKTLIINNHKSIKNTLKKVLKSNRAEFIEVMLKSDQRIIPKLQFGNPIEDLSPLLPRKEFNKNMLVPLVKRSKLIFEAN